MRDGTGRVDRGVGQRDADEVDEYQGQTDGQTAELAVGMAAVGDAEDDDQEHEGEDSFNDEGATSIDVPVVVATSGEVGTKVIGSEVASGNITTLGNSVNDSSSADGADDLCHPVDQHVFEAHATIGPNAKADSGIQVGTRDVANAVCHSHHGETESDSNA